MEQLAAFLDDYIEERLERPTVPARKHPPAAEPREALPLVRENAIRFAFAAAGSPAPPSGAAPDRLFLGIGNDLRPGVIDQHQFHSYGGSTARFVLSNRHIVTGAAAVDRDRATPFTIVLPEAPDFDSVVAAWLAIALLTTGELPSGAEALVRYADKIDEGSIGHSLSNPFSPYAAYMHLVHREAPRAGQPATSSGRHASPGPGSHCIFARAKLQPGDRAAFRRCLRVQRPGHPVRPPGCPGRRRALPPQAGRPCHGSPHQPPEPPGPVRRTNRG